MAITLLNDKYASEILRKQMQQEMVSAAEPVIKEALDEIEKKMRKKLGSMIIAYLDNFIQVDRVGQDLRILVKHEYQANREICRNIDAQQK